MFIDIYLPVDDLSTSPAPTKSHCLTWLRPSPNRQAVRTDAGRLLQEAGPLPSLESLLRPGVLGPPQPVHIHPAPGLGLGGLLQVPPQRAERRPLEGRRSGQIRAALQPLVLR